MIHDLWPWCMYVCMMYIFDPWSAYLQWRSSMYSCCCSHEKYDLLESVQAGAAWDTLIWRNTRLSTEHWPTFKIWATKCKVIQELKPTAYLPDEFEDKSCTFALYPKLGSYYIAFSVPPGHIAVKEFTFLLQRLGSYLSSCFLLCWPMLCLPLSFITLMADSNNFMSRIMD